VFAILRGVKLIENRRWEIPVGWHAIHTGSQHINDERGERTRQAWPDAPREEDLPHGSVVGLFYVQEHRAPDECRPGYIWARGPVCNVISRAIELPRPIRCRGDRGMWRLSRFVRKQIMEQLRGEEAPRIREFNLSQALGGH